MALPKPHCVVLVGKCSCILPPEAREEQSVGFNQWSAVTIELSKFHPGHLIDLELTFPLLKDSKSQTPSWNKYVGGYI